MQHAALKDIPVTVGQFSLVYLAGSKTNRMDSLTTLSSLFNTLRENKWKNTATFVHQLHNDSMLNHVFQVSCLFTVFLIILKNKHHFFFFNRTISREL